ncbi:MAG: L-2-amino-thiazoline-4-carboxylic acid hydrolase [Thermogutta sp.]
MNPQEKLTQLRQQLLDSYKNRALIYYHVYEELARVLGPEQAEELLKRAIHRRGQERGKEYAQFAPGNLAGVKDAFLAHLPDEGRLFEPEVLTDTPDALDIKFHRCPLREAWVEAGLSDELIARLCRIAAEVDYGLFGEAGFRFYADTWQAGGEGCCCLYIRPGNS